MKYRTTKVFGKGQLSGCESSHDLSRVFALMMFMHLSILFANQNKKRICIDWKSFIHVLRTAKASWPWPNVTTQIDCSLVIFHINVHCRNVFTVLSVLLFPYYFKSKSLSFILDTQLLLLKCFIVIPQEWGFKRPYRSIRSYL